MHEEGDDHRGNHAQNQEGDSTNQPDMNAADPATPAAREARRGDDDDR